MVEAAGSVSVGLLLWYGGGEVLHGAIGIGTLVAFKEYIHRFFLCALRDFQSKITRVMQSAMASAERIFQLLDTPLDVTNRKKRRRAETVFAGSGLRPCLVITINRRSGAQGVSFRHRHQAEKVAVVGATGLWQNHDD